MADTVQNVKKYWIFSKFMDILRVCMYLDNVTRPVSRPLGCSLVKFPSFWFKVGSHEVDPSSSVAGVWEIGCGSAAGHPIILSPCVHLLKTLYYEVLVVVFGRLWQLWLVEASKVRGMSQQKFGPLRWFFSSFWRSSWSRICSKCCKIVQSRYRFNVEFTVDFWLKWNAVENCSKAKKSQAPVSVMKYTSNGSLAIFMEHRLNTAFSVA